MYKYFVAVIIAVICLVTYFGIAKAETIDLGLTKWELPEAQAGMIVSFKEEGIEATLTTKLLSKDFDWGILSLNAGGAPAINEPIVSLTYQLPKDAMKRWNIDIPYADLFDIQAGLYMGFEMNEYENTNHDWKEAIDFGGAIIGASIKF